MNKASGGYGSHALFKTTQSKFLRRVIKAIYPPMPTLNVIPSKDLQFIQKNLFSRGNKILNIGCGGINGCGYRLWKYPNIDDLEIINIDIIDGPDVDIIADAHELPMKDQYFDAIVMQATLEHLKDPDVAIKEAYRVLKAGGFLYLEVPFLQGFHADPHDYQRYTLSGLKQRLIKFKEVLSGVSVGPFCTCAWIFRDGLSNIFRWRWLHLSVRFIVAWLTSPFRYLDYLVRDTPAAKRLACEYYFLCQKKL